MKKLNLHLFDLVLQPQVNSADANLNTQTTGRNTTGNNLSPEMKTYYEKRLLDAAEPNLVHMQFGDKYPIPAHGGKTIEFRRYSALPKALTALTEGVTPNGSNLNVETVTGTVSQYGDYVTISDVLELTAIDRNIEQATKLLGSSAGRTLDTVVRDIICAGTNVMYAPKVSGGTVTPVTARSAIDATALLTVDVIFKAVAALKAQNAAPIDDSFVAIVHPNVACDLMLSDKWVDVHKYAQPENIYRGEIGKIGGVRFVESTEAKCFGQVGAGTGTSQASVYATLVIGANAYGVTDVEGGGLQHIVKQLGSAGTADPLNQRATTGWKALQTAEILSQPYMIRIEHGCATAPTAPAN